MSLRVQDRNKPNRVRPCPRATGVRVTHGIKKSKTSTLARCRGPFSRFNPPSGARRDSDFSCRSRTPGHVCSSGLSIAGPAGHASIKACRWAAALHLHPQYRYPNTGLATQPSPGTSIIVCSTPVNFVSSRMPRLRGLGGPLKNNRTRDQTRSIHDRGLLSLCGRVESRRIESLLKCAKRELARLWFEDRRKPQHTSQSH